MIKVHTDAAYHAPTKKAGIGIRIQTDSQTYHYKISINNVFDNHSCEFIALYEALQFISLDQANETIWFHSDSKIVIDSLLKGYVKHKEYAKIFNLILPLSEQFPLFFGKWIPESQNLGADQLAKQALNSAGKSDKTYDYQNEFG